MLQLQVDEAEEDKHEHEKDKPEDRIERSQLEGSSFKWMKQRKTSMSTRKTSMNRTTINSDSAKLGFFSDLGGNIWAKNRCENVK